MTYRHNKRAVQHKNAGRDSILDGGYIGVVKNWIQDRGFGFINMGGRNVFVHMTQIGDSREELEVGETVYFEMQRDQKGRLSAKNVTTYFDNMQQQVQYVQTPTGQIFAVPVNPLQQQAMIQRYNEMVMVQNQTSLTRHSPQLQALNSVASEVPTLAPELSLSNSKKKPCEAKPTTKPETQAAAAHPCVVQQENQTPTPHQLSQMQQLQLQQHQMFQLQQIQMHQQLVQNQRVVLFPTCMASNIMLNQPAPVLPPGLTQNQNLSNVQQKKTNLHMQQKTNQGPVSQAGATHSFYKAFKPY